MKALLVFCLFLAGALPSPARCAEPGDLALRPGEIHPPLRQRGLDEVEAMPHFDADCPVCARVVSIPDVDRLVRRPAGADVKWSMQYGSRDADLAPYPVAGKIGWQADVAVCPECGYAAPARLFANGVDEGIAAWVRENLRPNIRRAERILLGKRADAMGEEEIIEFFNRQSEIPDGIRADHRRVLAAVAGAPKLEQAEATWLAAWALRRESAGPPRGAFLAKRAAAVAEAAARRKAAASGRQGDEETLRRLLDGYRSGKERFAFADGLAARLALAGVHIRAGRLGEASFELDALHRECRERFLRPDRDPLWSSTNAGASPDIRINELEVMRSEMENEIAARLDMVAAERDLLDAAAILIREAMLAGELDGKPEEALFHAYLVGEFLRRADHLALAAEWFGNLERLAPPDSDLVVAAAMQLAEVREQAGGTVNLLSALGQDGEALIRLREICGR